MIRYCVLLLLCLVLVCAGCSGLQAKGVTAKAIDADVRVMQARIASTQPDVDLADNSARFDYYYNTTTVNWFAYAFGNKTIYATPTIYSDLQGIAARAHEFHRRQMESTTRPAAVLPGQVQGWLMIEADWMNEIKNMKDGK